MNRSLAATYGLLEQPKAARRAVVGLLLIHSTLLAYSAYVHSPTLNEPGHLVAGLSYWKFGRFDIYNVNPPLVKMVAALPVMAAGYKEDWSGFYTGPGARPEYLMGEDFVAANGERSFFLFMIARWACIPFSWIGAIVCYLWARDLYGRPAGVVACGIWCLEPNILAHASLMTPDAHATALGLAACYTFWRWLKRPTWSQAVVTGAILGLAELAKTTLILFYPLWPLMWVVYRWPYRKSMNAREWFREGGMLVVRMLIGLYVVNLGYGFEGSLRSLGELHFVSKLFTDQRSGEGDNTAPEKQQTENQQSAIRDPPLTNRFADTFLRFVPVPFPKNYILGIDLQQRDFESYGRPSYLGGQWHDHGWWYYYLYAVAIKVPLGLWLLGVFMLIIRLFPSPWMEGRGSREFFDHMILLMPPLVIFIVVSSKTGFSEHMRYVLPCFPFVFICFSGWSKNFIEIGAQPLVDSVRYRRRMHRTLALPFSLTLLLWSLASSLWLYPHSLSYFNESIGGPLHGANHLLGSNVDWGQDQIYLHKWVRADGKGMSLASVEGVLVTTSLGSARVTTFIESRSSGVKLPSAPLIRGVGADSHFCWIISVNHIIRAPYSREVPVGVMMYSLSPTQVDHLRSAEHLRMIGYSLCVLEAVLEPRSRLQR